MSKQSPEAAARSISPARLRIRRAVRHFYDLQKLRIQSGNRNSKADYETLDKPQLDFLKLQASGLNELEKNAMKEIRRILKDFPIYDQWLSKQKGCGPQMSAVILAEVDISRDETPSQLWSYAGLAVDTATGKAVRPTAGKKFNWNPFLKTKTVGVLGDCLIKANDKWKKTYDNYKHRKTNERVPVCSACKGSGKSRFLDDEEKEDKDIKVSSKSCANCGGTGGPAPWGNSAAHRHQAAIRYMVKMFLLELWKEWRIAEGLPVVPSYAEVYLNRKHGDHGVPTAAAPAPPA